MSILPVGIGPQEGGYQIERSLRFNSADSAYLSRTPASAGNRKTWTWSGWVKRSALTTGSIQGLFAGVDSSNAQIVTGFRFRTDDALELISYSGGYTSQLITSQVFRDVSSWYHLVAVYDTTQATSSNRAKIYVNGSQVTNFSTATYPSQNYDAFVNTNGLHVIGAAIFGSVIELFNGYMANINFIDGQALDPTSFGEYNSETGVWQPIAYTGSYGTNGFYLDFADNSSTTALGYDAAGSNDWTPNNFSVTAGAGNDSLVDVPTNYGTDTGAGGEVRGNYATLNPLASASSLSDGNLRQATSAPINFATMGQSSGKWYWEVTLTTQSGAAQKVGIANSTATGELGDTSTGWAYIIQSNANNGQAVHSGTTTSTYSTFTTGDILNVAVDIDAGKIWWGKNGTWVNSGVPASGTGAVYTDVSGTIFPAASNIDKGVGSGVLTWNFGQRPFAYTAPSGFKALCTQNLPEPTVVDGGEYFNTVLWTGTDNAARTITGAGFQPGWVWAKRRSGAANHYLWDAVRGTNLQLFSNLTNAEANMSTSDNGGIGTAASDGFNIISGTVDAQGLNATSATFVAWNWKAGGTGVTNTAGTITSTVSANTTAGFSIVTYTGTGSAATVGHGLGVAPSMYIVKRRTGGVGNWAVWHTGLSNTTTSYILLDSTAAQSTSTSLWGSTAATSTTIGIGTSVTTNNSSDTYVAYCFAPIEGYSAFGSYTGNGSTDGPMVFTGFRVRWLLIKRTDTTDDWFLYDTARSTYNPANYVLSPNSSAADTATSNPDILSNGFKLRSTSGGTNGSGSTYIYAAFSEVAFKYALGR